jgi:hypothetical protein
LLFLVGLRPDLDLAEHELVAVGGGGHQMDLSTVGVDRAAQGLARPPRPPAAPTGPIGSVGRVGGARGARRASSASQPPITASTAGASTLVTTRHSVVFDGPPGNGTVQPGEQVGGHISDPPGDRGESREASNLAGRRPSAYTTRGEFHCNTRFEY